MPGDRVPADLRLISVDELQVDEAALTGESLPVDKTTGAAPVDATIGDRFGMAYSGTMVLHGQAVGIVVATGSSSEIGQIDQMLKKISTSSTPLLRQISHFGRLLALVILLSSVGIYAFGVLWHGHSFSEMFTMTVALAASAIPRAAGDHHRDVGDRGAANVASTRDHPSPAGGRGARVGDRDLFGQDRDPHHQRNDRSARDLRGADLRCRGCGIYAQG